MTTIHDVLHFAPGSINFVRAELACHTDRIAIGISNCLWGSSNFGPWEGQGAEVLILSGRTPVSRFCDERRTPSYEEAAKVVSSACEDYDLIVICPLFTHATTPRALRDLLKVYLEQQHRAALLVCIPTHWFKGYRHSQTEVRLFSVDLATQRAMMVLHRDAVGSLQPYPQILSYIDDGEVTFTSSNEKVERFQCAADLVLQRGHSPEVAASMVDVPQSQLVDFRDFMRMFSGK